MATNSRESKSEDRKNPNRRRHPNKYSTAFSNKLIDLAISADAEEAQLAQDMDSSILGQNQSLSCTEDFELSPEHSFIKPECTEEVTESGGSIDEFVSSNERFVIKCEEDDRDGTTGFSQAQSPVLPHSSALYNKRLNGFTSDPNLLTVFSSPCGDYFPKQSESDDELPEYVRLMMEKDVALKRLVKTGSVTISQVKEDAGHISGGDRVKNEFVIDNGTAETCNGNGDLPSRPYVPLANVEEWDTFPFAKRLLELAHLSVSGSTDISLPQTPKLPTINGSTATYDKMTSGQVKSFTTLLKKPTPSIVEVPKQVNKSHRNRKPLGSILSESEISCSSLPPPEPKSDGIRIVKVQSKRNSKKKKRIAAKPVHVQPEQSFEGEGDEQLDCFQFDPMKFLEVSLQVGKAPVPEDSLRRKYKCNFCDKKFCWSTDLKRHTLIHTGERPFKCSECSATFTRKFLMQKHIKKAHESVTGGQSHQTPPLNQECEVRNEVDEECSEWNMNGTEQFPVEFKEEEAEGYIGDGYEDFDMEEVRSDEEEGMEYAEDGQLHPQLDVAYLDL